MTEAIYKRCIGCNKVFDSHVNAWQDKDVFLSIHGDVEYDDGYYGRECIANYVGVQFGSSTMSHKLEIYTKMVSNLELKLEKEGMPECRT